MVRAGHPPPPWVPPSNSALPAISHVVCLSDRAPSPLTAVCLIPCAFPPTQLVKQEEAEQEEAAAAPSAEPSTTPTECPPPEEGSDGVSASAASSSAPAPAPTLAVQLSGTPYEDVLLALLERLRWEGFRFGCGNQ